jgi:hypothetical protein
MFATNITQSSAVLSKNVPEPHIGPRNHLVRPNLKAIKHLLANTSFIDN